MHVADVAFFEKGTPESSDHRVDNHNRRFGFGVVYAISTPPPVLGVRLEGAYAPLHSTIAHKFSS